MIEPVTEAGGAEPPKAPRPKRGLMPMMIGMLFVGVVGVVAAILLRPNPTPIDNGNVANFNSGPPANENSPRPVNGNKEQANANENTNANVVEPVAFDPRNGLQNLGLTCERDDLGWKIAGTQLVVPAEIEAARDWALHQTSGVRTAADVAPFVVGRRLSDLLGNRPTGDRDSLVEAWLPWILSHQKGKDRLPDAPLLPVVIEWTSGAGRPAATHTFRAFSLKGSQGVAVLYVQTDAGPRPLPASELAGALRSIRASDMPADGGGVSLHVPSELEWQEIVGGGHTQGAWNAIRAAACNPEGAPSTDVRLIADLMWGEREWCLDRTGQPIAMGGESLRLPGRPCVPIPPLGTFDSDASGASAVQAWLANPLVRQPMRTDRTHLRCVLRLEFPIPKSRGGDE